MAAPTRKLDKTPAEEPFVLGAMLSLLGAAAWIVARPGLLVQFFYSAETLALTHLVTLGFASSITLGVMLRLAPEALKVAPRARRLAWVEAVLFLLGASGMVFHFWSERWLGMAWAALLVLLVALMRAWNFWTLWPLARRGDWSARWVLAGLLHFTLAAALGSTFALMRVYGFGARVFDGPLVDRLAAHLHIAGLGWIGSVIFGFQLKLLPGTRTTPRRELARFVLHQVGVVGLASTLLFGGGLALPFAVLIVLSLASRSIPALRAWPRNRPSLWECVAHGLLLVLCAAGLLLAAGFPSDDSDWRDRAELAYVFVALFGWLLLTVAGTSWKLFSAWVWIERFWPEKQAGDPGRPIPAAVDLVTPWLRDSSGTAIVAGVAVAAAGILRADRLLVRGGAGVLAVGIALFFAHFLRMARWELLPIEWKPRRPAP